MAPRAYGNKTLQDNWFEDRVQSEIEAGHQARLQGATLREFEPALSMIVPPKGNQAERFATVPRTYRQPAPSTARALPDYSVGAKYETSSADQAGWARPPRSTAAHKPMVGMRQFGEIHKRGGGTVGGEVAAPAPGSFGSVLPAHDPGHDARHFATTNDDFYNKRVELARTQGVPPPEQADDTRFIGGYPAAINPNHPAKGAIHSAKHSFHKKSKLEGDF